MVSSPRSSYARGTTFVATVICQVSLPSHNSPAGTMITRIFRTHSVSRGGIAVALLVGIALPGCKEDAPSVPPIDYGSISTIKYSQHVEPLFTSRCATGGCHDSGTKAAGLALVSWDDVFNGSRFGEVVVPFQSTRSLLTLLFDGTLLRKAHPGGATFSSDEIAFLKRWINEGARNDDGSILRTPPQRRLYVPNQGDDNVAIVDLDRLVVSRYVGVGNSPANDAPHFVAANQDYWYVSLIGGGQVWKFDAHSDTLVASAAVAGSPALLELTPDGSKLYVSQFMTSSTNRVIVLNTTSMNTIKTIPVWTMPHGIRMNHAGTTLYVANMMSDNISVIDVATDSVVTTVPLAWDAIPFGPPKYMPMEIAVSPNDSIIMVTCSEWDEVRMFSAATNTLIDSFSVGDQPWHLQFTPDGEFCYVSNRLGNTVSAIHVPMRHVMSTISGAGTFALPHGCDISADGRHVFISSENVSHVFVPRYNTDFVGNVGIIDHATGLIAKVLEVGIMPTGLSTVH